MLDVAPTVLTAERNTIIFIFLRSPARTGRDNLCLSVNSIFNRPKKSPANRAVRARLPAGETASRSQCTGIRGWARHGNKVWVKSYHTCKHMICPKFSYWGKCWVRWEQSCKQVAVEKESENRKREPRVPKSWQPVTLFTIKRSKSFWVQSSICRQAWACYHICMKLNLQNQGVSHWSVNACNLKQRCWLGKSGPEGNFYHHDMWRIMHEHRWALWAVEILFCVQQWLALKWITTIFICIH